MGRPIIVALDMATATGFAHNGGPDPDIPVCGHFDIGKDEDNDGAAFFRFKRALGTLMATVHPVALAYETPIIIPGQRAHIPFKLVGLAAIAKLVAYTYQAKVVAIGVQTARRHLLGPGGGRADKQDVWHRCKVLGWPVTTLDESDACAILACAEGMMRSEAVRTSMAAQA